MSTAVVSSTTATSTDTSAGHLGMWAAYLLAVTAATAFALGITTPPRSGPWCAGNCIAYPYTDAAHYVPRDYRWPIPAALLTPLFLIVVACMHTFAPAGRKAHSVLSVCFAAIATGIITLDYFSQWAVAEPSLLHNETQGLGLFTQYNPHGFFIALEDLGYLMLAVAFLFGGTALARSDGLSSAVRWVFIVAGALTVASFVGMTWHFGLNLDYRFEVVAITIVWTTFIVTGVMLGALFRRGVGPA